MSEEWREVVDPNSGRTYYYNKKTRETTWTKPAGYGAAAAPTPAPAAATTASATEELEEWFETVDPNSGQKYYYNKKTKQTSWTAPVGAKIIQKKPKKSVAAESSAASTASPAPAATATVSNATAAPTPAPAAAAAVAPVQAAQAKTVLVTPSSFTTAPKHESASTLALPGASESKKGDLLDVEETAAIRTHSSSFAGKAQRRQRTGNMSPDGKWEEVLDPTTNKKYWYNRETKATAWVLPASAQQSAGKVEISPDVKAAAAAVAAPEAKAEPTLQEEDVERPSDRMVKLKQALNQQAATMGDDEEEDDDGDAYEFRFAKHRHGWINRTFRLGKAYDEEKLLTFKKSLIKKALLKKNRDLDTECIQAFKNIMSYMGDRKSSKDPLGHARKLIYNALTHPAGLRDEIYLQICKQTTNNPAVASTIKGWELMVYCLSSFPPSKQLKKFLTSYFTSTAESEQAEEKVRQYAHDALERLEKILLLGPRKEVPSTVEIDCIKTAKPIPVRVNFLNGSFKTLQVDSYVPVKDLEELLHRKLNLTLTQPFALYESNSEDTNMERICESKDRVVDIMASWDKEATEEEFKTEVTAGTGDKKKDLKKALTEQKLVVVPKYNQFLYKAKLVLKTADPDVMADPEAINMLWIQAVHDVVTSRYPVKEKDITVLGALQLQATFGDYQPDMHSEGWLAPKLHEFVPSFILMDKKGGSSEILRKEWEQKVLEKYAKLQGFTALEAKLNYLDYVQEWPFYGATFFTVEQRQFKDYPSPLTLGITCEGVVLMHPQKRNMLENYPYTDIVTWGHSDERFIVVVGNIVQQRKLIFKTPVGKIMNNLIHDYVKFKVKNKVTA